MPSRLTKQNTGFFYLDTVDDFQLYRQLNLDWADKNNLDDLRESSPNAKSFCEALSTLIDENYKKLNPNIQLKLKNETLEKFFSIKVENYNQNETKKPLLHLN